MPNFGTPPEGGSGLGDFLAGFLGTYGHSAAQREEQRLAREREQRYADQLAWERDQRERENARQDDLDRAAAAERGLRGILKDTAPGIDLNATVAVRSGPRGGEASVTPLGGGEPTSRTAIGAGEFLEPRYRDTGSGYVIDRSIADPGVIAHRQQRESDDRNANAIRGLAMLLGQDAGDLSVLAGTGISPDAAYRIGEGRAEDARARRGLETLAGRYGVDPAGLDTASLRSEVESRRGLAGQRSMAGYNHQLRMQEAAAEAAARPPFDPKRAASLRTEFRVRTKDFATQAQALGRIEAVGTNTDPTGSDDVALVFNYMKMLDPTSVVRESEYATAENTGLSVPENVRRLYNKALSGRRLTEEQRSQMVQTARRIGDRASRQNQELSTFYSGLATQEGIPPENIVYDYFRGTGPDGGDETRRRIDAYKARVAELVAGGMKETQARAKAQAEMEDE